MENANRLVAQILGGVLVLVGILGFIPGVVMDGALLGIFGVNSLHNVVHLLTGAILLGAAYMDGGKNVRMTNMVLGGVYLVVALVNFLPVDAVNEMVNAHRGVAYADAALHALLGIALLGVAFAAKDTTTGTRGAAVR